MVMLTDLADACRKSGLKVVEVPGWRTRGRPASTGGFNPQGQLNHHTGASDADPDSQKDDAAYADWLANVGRSDLPPPLCNTFVSQACVVYVIAAGRANHAGTAKASGPMPAGDGNEIYVGHEHQNNGTEGWDSTGFDAAGNEITQYDAVVRLNAALAQHYGWPADHSRAHKETSITGKWDPGLLDMDQLRHDIANRMEDDMFSDDDRRTLNKIATSLGNFREREAARDKKFRHAVLDRLDALENRVADDATRADVRRVRDEVAALAAEDTVPDPS